MSRARPTITDAEIRLQCKYALGRAARYAAKVEARCGWPQDLAGYQSSALLGVANALQKFDPGRGVKFATFCFGMVGGALSDEARTQDCRPAWKQYRHLPPADHELPPLSLSAPAGDGGDDDFFLNQIEDPSAGPEELAVRFSEAEEAASLVARLPPFERGAVQMRLWDECTYGEIAGSQGSSREGARHRVGRGLARIRE